MNVYHITAYCISFFFLQIKPFYTEDVYKRQVFTHHSKGFLKNTFYLFHNLVILSFYVLQHKIIPVSYTHLDVYKRQ